MGVSIEPDPTAREAALLAGVSRWLPEPDRQAAASRALDLLVEVDRQRRASILARLVPQASADILERIVETLPELVGEVSDLGLAKQVGIRLAEVGRPDEALAWPSAARSCATPTSARSMARSWTPTPPGPWPC